MNDYSVLIIGARRRKQGLGEFIAKWFSYAGARVCALVGTTDETVKQAQQSLSRNYHIDCNGYTCAKSAVKREQPDITVICSPYRFHREHLEIAANAGTHCLCEKPMWWEKSTSTEETEKIVDAFLRRGRHLALVTQWPYTLPYFYKLYPHIKGKPIESFAMEMGPISIGVEMIIDSAPHVLSMLQALAGEGKVQDVKSYLNENRSRMTMEFRYLHTHGSFPVTCNFTRTKRPPRPASYAINGCRVKRSIRMPEYRLYFSGESGSIALDDPVKLLVENFLYHLSTGKRARRESLINGITELKHLVEAFSRRTFMEKKISSPTDGKKHIELSAIHNFAAKLCQRHVLPRVKEYVHRQTQMRQSKERGKQDPFTLPDFAPMSINLDLTTSCNYACDHCVDMKILNKKIWFDHQNLMESLNLMADKGLQSVIVIGGGEPTVYPKFSEIIRHIKSLGLDVSIVSNGSRNQKIAEIANCLQEYDWVRLSLDSGSDKVFQAMHHPRKAVTLDDICEWVPKIKTVNSCFKLGFSFMITWKNACINDTNIVENIHEMVLAAERAKKYGFDYIAFKPFLTRAPLNNAEIVDLKESQEHFDNITRKIEENVKEAKKLESTGFNVYATSNLKVLINRSAQNYMQQPHQCHMQFFRQVLSPLGIYNCPAYRNQSHGRLGDKESYSQPENYAQTLGNTAQKIMTFDANQQCCEVTCLYNHVNWWLEDLITHPEKLEKLREENIEPDNFL